MIKKSLKEKAKNVLNIFRNEIAQAPLFIPMIAGLVAIPAQKVKKHKKLAVSIAVIASLVATGLIGGFMMWSEETKASGFITGWTKSGSNPLWDTAQGWMCSCYNDYDGKIYIFIQNDTASNDTIECLSFTLANAADSSSWTDHGSIISTAGGDAWDDSHIEPHGIIFETQAMADARENVGSGLGTKSWRLYYCGGTGLIQNYGTGFYYHAPGDLSSGWTYYTENPVFPKDATYGYPDSKAVVYNNEVWILIGKTTSSIYDAFFTNSSYGLGYANNTWTNHSSTNMTSRLLMGTLVVTDNGILITGDGQTNPDEYRGNWTDDGDALTQCPDNPILTGGSSQWDNYFTWNTIVVDKDGSTNLSGAGTRYMYYAGYFTNVNDAQIGLATTTISSTSISLSGLTSNRLTWSGNAGNTVWCNATGDGNETLNMSITYADTNIQEVKVYIGDMNDTGAYINASNLSLCFSSDNSTWGASTRNFVDGGSNISINSALWTTDNGCYGANPFPISSDKNIYARVKLTIPAGQDIDTYWSASSTAYKVYILG